MANSSSTVTVKRDAKVAIVGSGLIGRSWAMLFVSAGYDVCLFDIEPSQLEQAKKAVWDQLNDLKEQGLLRGSLSVQEQYDSISTTASLAECVQGAVHVQECVPEKVEMKREIFTQLDALADDRVILCSSSSAIVPSMFTENLKNRSRCLVAHPDGVVSVADVETAVIEGLAPRYAFMGPFETCHLNANGMKDYCDRYGKTIYDVQRSFGAPEQMQGAKAEQAERDIAEWVPLETLPQRRQWRDKRLAALAKLKHDLGDS